MWRGLRFDGKDSEENKSLFDHIKQITDVQNPNYWDEISEEDKRVEYNYMVNRFLSMKMDWIDIVNEVQKYNLGAKYYINCIQTFFQRVDNG